MKLETLHTLSLDLMDQADRIKLADRLISSLDKDITEPYIEEMLLLVNEYNRGCEDLLLKVDEYIAEEERLGNERELWVHQLRRSLGKD